MEKISKNEITEILTEAENFLNTKGILKEGQDPIKLNTRDKLIIIEEIAHVIGDDELYMKVLGENVEHELNDIRYEMMSESQESMNEAAEGTSNQVSDFVKGAANKSMDFVKNHPAKFGIGVGASVATITGLYALIRHLKNKKAAAEKAGRTTKTVEKQIQQAEKRLEEMRTAKKK